MSDVKGIILKPISPTAANDFVARHHYSGKVVPNSQLHLGCYSGGVLHGVMQYGPSMVKDNLLGLVNGTGWNQFIELNRMAFDDQLPKNSESRCIAISLKLLKKHYPHLKWVITFADGTQCGDGTIYRAANFLLTGIKKNDGLRKNPETGEILQQIAAHHRKIRKEFTRDWIPLPGYQLRYVYFLDPAWRNRLTVPVLPYSDIQKAGAGMYKGRPLVKKADCPDCKSHDWCCGQDCGARHAD